MSKLIKLTDKDRGAFVSRFKQKQKPRILWSSKARLDSEPAIPFTGVPFAVAVCPKKAIPCPNLNCNAQICVRLIWTFPNSACVRARMCMFLSVLQYAVAFPFFSYAKGYICDHRGKVPLNTERVHADICSGKIIPVAQYHITLPTRQAHTCLQNRPTHSATSQSVPATGTVGGFITRTHTHTVATQQWVN